MPRLTPTDDNLSIAIDDADVETYAIATARALGRLGERRVYFLSLVPLNYPSLRRFKGLSITFLSSGQSPADLVRSARMVHSKGRLVVASPRVARKDLWMKVGADIEADVARGIVQP